MMRSSKLLPIGLALVIGLLVGCNDDVASSDADCASGDTFDPIAEECVPCPEDDFNPITEQCEADFSNDGNANSGNDANSGGNDNSGTGDNDNSDNGGTNPPDVEPPHDPYQPQDPDTAEYHSCESDDFDGIDSPTFIHHGAANYLLAAAPGVDAASIDSATVDLDGHVFEDGAAGYAGFVLSFSPPSGQTSAAASADWLFDQIDAISEYDATRQGSGNPYQTHDNFSAHVLNHVAIETTDAPGAVRDRLLASFRGIAAADIDHNLAPAADADGSGAHLVYKTVARTEDQVIVVGGVTTGDRHDQPDGPARFAVQDLASGTALAPAGETMSDECVSMEVRDTDEVDIIISMDASGSMTDVQNALSNFADDLTQVLDDAGVDWRVGVTGVDCDNIREDTALSPEYRALWPDPDDWEGDDPPFPFPGMPDDLNTPCVTPDIMPAEDNNGRLMEGTFTTDASEIASRLQMVSTTGLEYTMTMGVAAIDHSLPRADNDPTKLRTHAAPVVIAVTDENEQLFKDAFESFISHGNDPLSASDFDEMTDFIQPWIDYLHRPDIRATISGLYWVPGTTCDGGEDVAHGIHHVVEQTGGVHDSICSPNITQSFADIADATQDLETGLHLIGRPLASSVTVDVSDINGNNATPMNRSIVDGFDFDSASNSLFFEGPSAPDEEERVVVPYLQWDGNIVPCDDDYHCTGGKKCTLGTCE